MVMMGFVIFGLYYAYDSVVPIANEIIKNMGITRAQYGLLFSYYSLPNFIMVLLGGMLIDKIGIRRAGTLLAILSSSGVFLTAAGPSFPLMLWGRLLYGIGAESLCIAELKILSKWFKGKELAFALGLNVTLVRLGNFASLNLSAPLHSWSGNWRTALWVAFAVIVLSMLTFLIYSRLDKAKEKFFERGKNEGEKIIFRNILSFKTSYWFVTILCVTIYSAVLPFVAFSNIFLQKEFDLTATQAGFFASIIFITTMTVTPLFGIIVDKIGKRATIMMIGSLIIVPAYLALGLTTLNPALSIVGIGIAFSLVPSALWSSIPIMVEQRLLGTAFGLIALIQNIGLTLFPWIAGRVTDISRGDYTPTMLMFASLGFISLAFSFFLKRSEKKNPTGIELPSKLVKVAKEGN